MQIDGKRVGTTPLVKLKVASGKREVVLRNPLEGAYRKLTVDVHAGVLMGNPEHAKLPAAYEAVELFDEALLHEDDGEGRSARKIGIAALARKVLVAGRASGRRQARSK